MKRIVYHFFVLLLIACVAMANQKGRAAEGAKGSTGAPGDDDTVCKSCHNGPINVEVKIHVLDGIDTIVAYEPNKTYKIHVKVNHTGGNVPKAFGFQMTLLNAAEKENGTNLKDISPLSSNVKLTTPRNGRLYAEHVDRSDLNLFEVQWVAPNAGSGPVTIYAGGTGVNSNGSDSGDGGAKVALQINEKLGSSVGNGAKSTLRVYPNPFSDQINIELNGNQLSRYELLDLFGVNIISGAINNSNLKINTADLKDGIYFIKFFGKEENLIKTQKLIKRSVRS